jgi:Na+/serine symporter
MIDVLTAAADRLNSIEPTLQQALILFGVAASCASLAAGIVIGALWARAAR